MSCNHQRAALLIHVFLVNITNYVTIRVTSKMKGTKGKEGTIELTCKASPYNKVLKTDVSTSHKRNMNKKILKFYSYHKSYTYTFWYTITDYLLINPRGL